MKIELVVFSILVLVANLALEAECFMCSTRICPKKLHNQLLLRDSNDRPKNDYRLAPCANGKGLCVRHVDDLFNDKAEDGPETAPIQFQTPRGKILLQRRIEALRRSKPFVRGSRPSVVRMREATDLDDSRQ